MQGLQYPEADILRVSKVTRDNALANESGLKKFGWDMPKISAFAQDIVSTEALGNQAENLLGLRAKTVEKDDIVLECEQWLSDLGERVKQVWKRTSAQYQSYPYKLIREAHGSESKVMPVMETGVKFGADHQLDLLAVGHTEEEQARGVSLQDAIRDKDQVQEGKKESNQEATQVRYLKFSKLIDDVNKINAAGRKAFRNQPEKLVLFNSPWPKHSKKKTPPPPPPATPPESPSE